MSEMVVELVQFRINWPEAAVLSKVVATAHEYNPRRKLETSNSKKDDCAPVSNTTRP